MVSDENILAAIEKVNKSHRWNKYPDKPNKTVLWVERTKEERVKELREIIERGFEQQEPKIKRRYDANAGKWRDIAEPRLWPDQYVHHILVQVMEPTLMRGMDPHCCGSIKGRGAHMGIRLIKRWMKKDKSGTRWCLEMDIRHFYDSLKPEIVMDRLKRLFKDRRVLDLAWRIIKDGIRIGYYTSQWFANTVLQPVDWEIRRMGAVHSIRYLDNFTVFSNRRRVIKKALKVARKKLEELSLKLKGNFQYFRTDKRMPDALGYRYGRGYTLLRKHNRRKLKREVGKFLKQRRKGIATAFKFASGLLSRLGMLRHCNSFRYYAGFPRGTQKRLKDIIRANARKERMTWNMYLAQYERAA